MVDVLNGKKEPALYNTVIEVKEPLWTVYKWTGQNSYSQITGVHSSELGPYD